jgi:hypothetical protein
MMKTLLMVSLIAVTATEALACCMVPVSYKGSIGQDTQEAVLIHDGDREELILRINYRITGDKMPENFAWVITTPHEPDSYAVADAELFNEMFDLAQRLLVPKSRSKGRQALTDAAVPEGVELGRRVQVGPYDIQPVRGVGPDALVGLNTWLGTHGFPTEPPDHMTFFVENGFTFLCVRITPPDEQKTVSAGGPLPPLHLSFQSPTPYYPLRFSSRQGVFDVNLHVLTRNKLDYDQSAATLARLNWTSHAYKRNAKITSKDMPNTLKQVFGKSAWQDKVASWRYNNLRCSQVNKGHSISKWKDDITFVTGGMAHLGYGAGVKRASATEPGIDRNTGIGFPVDNESYD